MKNDQNATNSDWNATDAVVDFAPPPDALSQNKEGISFLWKEKTQILCHDIIASGIGREELLLCTIRTHEL